MYPDMDPKLVRAAREVRSTHRHLYVMRLPLARPYRKRVGWKRKNGKRQAVVELLRQADFLIRPLNAVEFDQFAYEAQMTDITEDVVRTALLFPKKKQWKKNPVHWVLPGHFEGIRDRIIEVSGFGSQEALEQGISYGREQAGTLYGLMQAFISRAFPSYTPIEISKMAWLDQVRLIGAAEIMLEQEFPLRDILTGSKEGAAAKPPRDFSKLPQYTPEEIEAMRSDSARKAMVDQMYARRRASRPDGDDAAARARARVDQVAQKRMEQEQRQQERG